MLLDLLYRDLPSLNRVAQLAIGSQLTAVDIGVAIGALCAHIGEYGFGVALLATDACMQSAQWKFCPVVIELGHSADRLPAGKGMAVLAGNVQVSVRAARRGIRLRLPSLRHACRQQCERGHKIQQKHGPQSARPLRDSRSAQIYELRKKMTE